MAARFLPVYGGGHWRDGGYPGAGQLRGPGGSTRLQDPVLQHCKSLLALHLPFQPTISRAELTRSPGGNGARGVKSDSGVEMSRKPALSPLAALCRAISHAGDPMLGDMGSERGNV